MNKFTFIFIVVLFCGKILSQNIKPNTTIPHKKGDIFQYQHSDIGYQPDTIQVSTISDSVDSSGNIYFTQKAINTNPTKSVVLLHDSAGYKIDQNNNVWGPGLNGGGLIYKLNGKTGESWCLIEGNNYAKAKIGGIFQMQIFGHLTNVIEFDSYFWYSKQDSITMLVDLVTLEYGIIARLGTEEGPGRVDIIGADINGIQYGNLKTVSVRNENTLPNDFTLDQNYPNPFNPSTTIRFRLAKPSEISIIVYDIQGRQVAKLIDKKYYQVGSYNIVWNGSSDQNHKIASGVYFYTLFLNNDKFKTKSMILLK